MARYYCTFDGSTVAALEANAANKRFKRITAPANGATLKQALLDQRAALDAAVRPQLTAANNNGANGTVVPVDAMTRGGTNTTTGLYTHAQAVYNADPQVRPTIDITVANATPVAPANPLTIANATLDAARTAVNNAVTAVGVYTRLGLDGAKTLRSLFCPADCSYFAWDNFTPEAPLLVSLVYNPPAPTGGASFSANGTWSYDTGTDNFEAQTEWSIDVGATQAIGAPGGTGVQSATNSGLSAIGVFTGNLSVPGGLQSGFRYRVNLTVRGKYASGVFGPYASFQTATFDIP